MGYISVCFILSPICNVSLLVLSGTTAIRELWVRWGTGGFRSGGLHNTLKSGLGNKADCLNPDSPTSEPNSISSIVIWGEFPGGPLVRTPCSQVPRTRVPTLVRELTSHKPYGAAKKKMLSGNSNNRITPCRVDFSKGLANKTVEACVLAVRTGPGWLRHLLPARPWATPEPTSSLPRFPQL